jgi:hypothetical protein
MASSHRIAATLVAATLAGTAQAATYTVTSAADSGSGTLRAALLDMASRPASENHDINLLLAPDQTLSLLSPLPPIQGRSVSINAQFSPTFVITGLGLNPIFELSATGTPTSLSLTDFSVQSGRRSAGGCLYDPEVIGRVATITLQRMRFTNCFAQQVPGLFGGGAVRSAGGTTLIVIDSQFTNNEAQVGLGGAAFAAGGAIAAFGPALVSTSTFTNNTVRATTSGNTGSGAALWAGSSLELRDSHFVGNAVITVDTPNASYGAVICGVSGPCTVDSSSFTGNPSIALAMGAGPSVVVNSSFWDNGSRSALFAFPGAGTLRIRNSSFLRDAGGPANAFAFLSVQTTPGQIPDVRVSNNLFGPTGGATFSCGATPGLVPTGGGWNLATDGSCSVFSSATTSAPLIRFGPALPARGRALVLSLASDSVAIDSGNPDPPGSNADACEPVDATGRSRPRNGNPDIVPRCDYGAFEVPDEIIFRSGFER